jgi:hypothetical protein
MPSLSKSASPKPSKNFTTPNALEVFMVAARETDRTIRRLLIDGFFVCFMRHKKNRAFLVWVAVMRTTFPIDFT